MSEYWKSTNRYWCKHCSTFVRDTKLERANHEATGKHQGAVKRSLRDLHRNADQKEREQDRAKREVERLNGVVSGTATRTAGPSKPAPKPTGGAYGAPSEEASQQARKKQLEQLAELGVSIPTELRGDMAMAGEWTVTATKILEDPDTTSESKDAAAAAGRATGVKRERERTEEEKEQEDAINGLFKKQRKWGVDSKTMPADEDADLEALLSGPLVKTKKEEAEPPRIKAEDGQGDAAEADGAEDVKPEPSPTIKREEPEPALGLTEERVPGTVTDGTKSTDGAASAAGAVMFKKRKPKNMRQK
jgi:hypothetical protein